jgi:hypothetical protein
LAAAGVVERTGTALQARPKQVVPVAEEACTTRSAQLEPQAREIAVETQIKTACTTQVVEVVLAALEAMLHQPRAVTGELALRPR